MMKTAEHVSRSLLGAGDSVKVPYRPVRLETLTVSADYRDDGAVLLRSEQPLGAYDQRATDRLAHWAARTPDSPWLAWRASDGSISRLTYGAAFDAVQRLAQALLDRGASQSRPLVVLSGNSAEHALLTYAAMYTGVTCVPVSPAYSLLSDDFALLKTALSQVSPALVFANDGARFARAITAALSPEVERVVASTPSHSRRETAFETLLSTPPTAAVSRAHARVGPDTVAKILFTSGSTGTPKGVLNTHRMLTSNQQMIAQVMPFLEDEPPVLVDWLPWHHTFGGNHNLGMATHHGGCLFIDEGRPVAGAFEPTVRTLREMPPTIYLNVPKGYEELVHALRRDTELRTAFFSRVRLMFSAAAGLSQSVADDLQTIAAATCGERIVMATALGATETAPMATARTRGSHEAAAIGLPVPGMDAKLVRQADRFELRLRGPNVTPGYCGGPELTRRAFDEEGFYCIGDAVRFVDDHDVNKGLLFDGRIAEDFKLSTGTWVHVGALRSRILTHFAPYLRDVVITGENRDSVGMLAVPDVTACRAICADVGADASHADVLRHPQVRQRLETLLRSLAAGSSGSARRVERAILLEEAPSFDAQEITDKGSLNQRAILKRRVAIVEMLYADPTGPDVMLARLNR